MKKLARGLAIVLILLAFGLPLIAHAQTGAHVDVMTLDGTIDTWIDGYIQRGISVAEQDGAQAAIIVLNTPGGALNAMQDITNRELNARVPVVVFVYPKGAWAASAGTFVTLAANIAAMAPGTTIGAAHPVDASGQNIPTDENTKVTNFSVGIIKNIAQERGRNATWAANAVQNSVAATAPEALDQHVIDLVANDLNDLLNKIDGMTVKTAAGEITLHTQRAGINYIDMNLPELFFHTIVDPNLALILLQVGLLAIAVELYNPGATIPAIVGGICLVLAFVALGNLPVNWGGVILIVLSVVAFLIDVKVNSIVLTAGGFAMFILGGLLLFTPITPQPPTMPNVSVSPIFLLVLGAAEVAFFLFLLGAVVRSHRFPVLTGKESMVGVGGIVTTDLTPAGMVQVKGEVWSALAQEDSIKKGDHVQVAGVDGLRLKVVKK